MNLRIGKVQGYNNKILVSRTGFKIGTNLKINLDVKSKEVEMVKTKPDVKLKVKTKPNIEPNKKHKQDAKPNIKFDRESKQDVKNLIQIRSPMRKERLLWYWEWQLSLQYGGCSNDLSSPCICHEICVYQNSNTCDKCPQVLRKPTNHFIGSVQDPWNYWTYNPW